MIEVFKTDVTHQQQAVFLLDLLHKTFADAMVTIDLEDCDKVMRFESTSEVPIADVLWVVKAGGFVAEMLPD